MARSEKMAQLNVPGLHIDTSFSSGQLSLHEYRKLLSREDSSHISPSSPRPRLKRKPAALNLSQRSRNDLGFQLQSPVSSAPSSPPPLSFSQSVISLSGGDLPTPISPMPMMRPFSRQLPSSQFSGARRMDRFSTRLKTPALSLPGHSRTSSDSTLLSTSTPIFKLKDNGAEFEILNPKSASSLHLGEIPTYRPKDAMEEESPDTSPTHSLMSYTLPDDMMRPLSASESAVLSKYRSPAMSPGLPQSSYSFGALPPLNEQPPSPVSPRTPRSPARTLKQKMSRLFGSSEKRSSPRHEVDTGEKIDSHHAENVPHSPLSNHWEQVEPARIEYQPETRVDTTSFEYDTHDSTHRDYDDLASRRRPTWGPHSSNRHQTLQDALRQMETDNNGLRFEDIMHFIGVQDEEGSQPSPQSENEPLDEKVERPWQPDTWNEPPTLMRMPHNRPSDSNLSTNAPSTRASIRPYVERAAAFMAGASNGFSSSSSSFDVVEEHDASDVKILNADEGRHYEDEEDYETEGDEENEDGEEDDDDDDGDPALPLRRSVSRRARPLSSNPPELDTPLLFDSSSSSSLSSSLALNARAPTPLQPSLDRTTTPQPLPKSRISWTPDIPARHPEHRFVHFQNDIPIKPRASTPAPLTSTSTASTTVTHSAGPTVVTTTITAPRKKAKKRSSGCHCL